MRTKLIIDAVVIFGVALILYIMKGIGGGSIIDLALLIAVIILIIVGIIRLLEGLLQQPRKRAARTVHHIHHYEKESFQKKSGKK